jgi:4-hydroxyphenylpyruvate dioxygenase
VSISGDLKQKLAAIAKAGFDGVEIFENGFLIHNESPRAVGQMSRDYCLGQSVGRPGLTADKLSMAHPATMRDESGLP